MVYYTTIILLIIMLLMIVLATIDVFFIKRKLISHPFISFIIPCYNNHENIKKTIKSIYDSYDNFELFVINDKSTDSSLKKIQEINKEYNFKLINNKINLGKAKSINNCSELAKGEILFVLDSDTLLAKKNVEDIIKRFDANKKVMAVSCPCISGNSGFWPYMQTIESMMLTLTQLSSNMHSALGLVGACLAVKKKAFEEVGKFSENAIIEDANLALKLNKKGWKVEQSKYPAYTIYPNKIKSWWKQKIRWTSGQMQNLINYFGLYCQHPIVAIFLILYFLVTVFFAISVYKSILFLTSLYSLIGFLKGSGDTFLQIFAQLKLLYGVQTVNKLIVSSLLMTFSLPYVIMDIKNWKEIYKIFYIIPYTLIYIPMYSVSILVGFYVGVKRYKKLKKGERAW
jgi:cellulose synthase/poly-beta-1,6-N-acetylglucosamine synthase-like glycosyltransferase